MRDARITLTDEDRDTLRHLFDFALAHVESRLGVAGDQDYVFAFRLARSKLARLKDKLLPTKETE